jgi:hypothetical protein
MSHKIVPAALKGTKFRKTVVEKVKGVNEFKKISFYLAGRKFFVKRILRVRGIIVPFQIMAESQEICL